jgi:hypothetical protein
MVILACVRNRSSDRTRLGWLRDLSGWQKVFGAVAIVAALLIVLNPEFFALGLLGDTAFFDLLALALALQLHTIFVQALQMCAAGISRGARFLGIPSPSFLYLLAMARYQWTRTASAFQKALTRQIA